jgi:hypothetical protein
MSGFDFRQAQAETDMFEPTSHLDSTDIVAIVENRTTLKISRKLIFGFLYRCVAFQRHYGDPWSILDETIWSLTSPSVKRIVVSTALLSARLVDDANAGAASIDKPDTACSPVPPHDMAALWCFEAINWQIQIRRKDVKRALKFGPLIADVFHDAAVNAGNSVKGEHRGLVDFNPL